MRTKRITAGLAAVVLVLAFAGTALAADATVTGHEAFSNEANQPSCWGAVERGRGRQRRQFLCPPRYRRDIRRRGDRRGEFRQVVANTIFDDPAEGSTVWRIPRTATS